MPNATGQFRIATNQFGHVMFCMSERDNSGYPFTDRIETVPAYDYRDNRDIKLKHWKSVAESCGLDSAFIHIVEA